MLDGGSLAAFTLYYSEARMCLGKRLCDLQCFVHTPVFDNDHFRCKGLLLKKTKHLLQCIGQAVFLIMSGDDDG